ncbi:putative rhamnosyl transferase [Paenibacillus spongiae]|uniref:Rhamnosyl transferase n=1 Tax=Paenibacillus spongiae TaxID=2909671 RepID=A0ABY5S412_9BACL|nr:putative rhamnosyl transferase [Paenibacillus spongiae]UVI28642.1 putative rhamnosyl transferase [Paenibacillus spongiae]
MSKTIIVGIEFNSRSKPNNHWQVGLTQSWIEYRMSIFMKYTLQSLKKQTNQNFTALIHYAEISENIVLQTLNRYEPLPSNIQFVPNYRRSMEIQENISFGCDDLYLVRLDCDDTYRKSFIQQLHDYTPQPDTCALINQAGYIYDSVNHRIAAVTTPSPPFYTWIFKRDEYLAGKYYPSPNGHGGVIMNKHEILTTDRKRNYMIVVHERNTANQEWLSFADFESNPKKVNAVLKKFI